MHRRPDNIVDKTVPHNSTPTTRRKTPPRIKSVIVKPSNTTVNQIEKRREETREEAELLDRVCNDNVGDCTVMGK